MRVVTDLATGGILQVEKSPPVGEARAFNGRFAVPIPEGVPVDLTSASYVFPVDGGDVSSLAMASLLAQYPMYAHVVFNPLLTATDIADLDLAAVFTPTGDVTRAVVGRGAGPLPTGTSPNAVCVLNQNNRVAPSRPGCLISDTIDVGPATGGVGADEVMVWWVLYELSTSDDVTSDAGAGAGRNDPAIRYVAEADPEPSGFQVNVSNDDGVTYTVVSRMTPTNLGAFGTLLRIAFRNTSNTTKRYVGAYAILF